MTLEATSSTITATVAGLDTSYAYDRRFVWYLDGEKRTEETVSPGSASHTYTMTGVYFYSQHHVKLAIYSTVSGNLLAEQEGTVSTLYANIPLWSWSASNGDASAAQTAAAYTAATSKGLVTDFSSLVWDDLVTLLHTALTDAGVRWLGIGYDNLLLDAGDPLTAQKFNTVVQNIRYPFWTWNNLPGSTGFLDRLDMRSGDWVYGAYIIELTKRLNTVIGIYNGTANVRETGYTESMSLRLDDAWAVARRSAPAAYTEHIRLDDAAHAVARHSAPAEIKQSMLLSHAMGLIAKGKADMEYDGHMALLDRLSIAVNGNLSPVTVDAGLSELNARMVVDASPTLHLPVGSAVSAVNTSATLRSLISGRMESVTNVFTNTMADLRRYASRRISADTAIAARTSAELTRHMAGILASSVRLSETVQAGMTRAQAQNATSGVTVRIADSGDLRAVRAANTGGSVEIIHIISGAADRARPRNASVEVTQTVTQTGEMRKAVPKSAAAQSTSAINTMAQAKPCKPVSVFAGAEVAHAVSGTAVQSRPKLLTGHAMSGADGTGTAVLRPALRLSGHSGNVVSFASVLGKRKALRLSGVVDIAAATSATLTLQDVPVVDWEYPVQMGDKLKITQVYDISTMGGVLELDAKLWDYPKADEDKLLIIQAYNPVPMGGVLEFDGDTFAVPYAYSVTETGEKLEVE